MNSTNSPLKERAMTYKRRKRIREIEQQQPNVVPRPIEVAGGEEEPAHNVSKEIQSELRRESVFNYENNDEGEEEEQDEDVEQDEDEEVENEDNEEGGEEEQDEAEEEEDGRPRRARKKHRRLEQILTGPHEGGPEEPTLLPSFLTHVASKVWVGENRGVMKCMCHTKKLLQWVIPNDHRSQIWRGLISRSRIQGLRDVSYMNINRSLICAFVERWHPETNSFHMPWGEMTITLEDVFCLTGLPVEGLTVDTPDGRDWSALSEIQKLLMVSEKDAKSSLKGARGSSVMMKWLKKRFQHKVVTSNNRQAHAAARAYLWYILGCTIFSDKSGSRVSTKVLQLLDDVTTVQKYAWGTAALALLYRQLGLASRHNVRQISGYLTILQAWIYEYFPIFRPPQNVEYDPSEPLAIKWGQVHSTRSNGDKLTSFRETLDSYSPNNVNWTPYSGMRDLWPRPEVTFYQGCIRAFKVVEPYHPERVLRQFGYIQPIPRTPLIPVNTRRAKSGQAYTLWNTFGNYFQEWDNHLLSEAQRGSPAFPPSQCVFGYMEWFRKVSHPIVQNPRYRSGIVAHGNPWDLIMNARELMEPLLQRWRDNDVTLNLDNVMPTFEEAFAALEAPQPQAQPIQPARGTGEMRAILEPPQSQQGDPQGESSNQAQPAQQARELETPQGGHQGESLIQAQLAKRARGTGGRRAPLETPQPQQVESSSRQAQPAQQVRGTSERRTSGRLRSRK